MNSLSYIEWFKTCTFLFGRDKEIKIPSIWTSGYVYSNMLKLLINNNIPINTWFRWKGRVNKVKQSEPKRHLKFVLWLVVWQSSSSTLI